MKQILTDEYIAGFFDGEGCISIAKRPRPTAVTGYYYALHVSLSQQNPYVLELIRAQYGILPRLYRNVRRDGGKRPVYEVRIFTANAERFLLRIAPYLVVKYDEAQLALRFEQHRRESRLHGLASGSRNAGGRHNDAIAEIKGEQDVMYHQMRAFKGSWGLGTSREHKGLALAQ